MTIDKPMVVFTIDGVGSSGVMPATTRLAIKLAGGDHDVRHFVWGHGFGRLFADIRDREHMYAKAANLALTIEELYLSGRRVSLVAKSGGTGVALKALELLPPDSVETVILLAPAVSPSFDLHPALRAVKTKIYSFNSSFDLFWLGLCTSVVCTADGVRTKAAGCVGFQNASQYEKLEEINWSPLMMRSLHFGTHFGTSMYPFLRTYVVPLLQQDMEPCRL